MSCEKCFQVFSKMKKPTPCGPCPKPFLVAANEPIWELFVSVGTQARVGGMGGAFGLDFGVLEFVFGVFQVQPEDRYIYLLKLNHLYGLAIAAWNKADNKNKERA